MDNREVSAIRVICRFRPLNSSEQSRGDEDLPKFDQGRDHIRCFLPLNKIKIYFLKNGFNKFFSGPDFGTFGLIKLLAFIFRR